MTAASQALANGRRLRADAALLSQAGRYQSSVLLGILALEELGKAFILGWEARNRASKRRYATHLEKQSAVFCVLSANELLKNKKRVLRLNQSREFNFHKVGPYSSQLAWARSGFFDDLRHAATYADEEPKLPPELMAEVDAGLSKEILQFFDSALKVIRNRKAMALGLEIYENDLGRL